MKAVLKRKNYRDYLLFVVGINTGLRISDLLQLKVGHTKNSHIIITEGKTGKIKRFPINSNLRELLDEYTIGMSDDDYLFPSRKGEHIGRVQAYRILNDAAKEVGLDEIGTHTLRKTFGYHHYQRYKDVALLQEIFNHSSPSITLRYIGINQDAIDASLAGFFI
jgi:integrase